MLSSSQKTKSYKPERFQSISRYFEHHSAPFQIDDLTWNDLELDKVYKRIDRTVSATGEEYLYYLLRTPEQQKQALQDREQKIHYFEGHSDCCKENKELLKKLGYTGKYSVYDYLSYLDQIGERKSTRHYLAILSVLVAIGILFLSFPIGLALLFLSFVWNVISYFKIKAEIDPYIISFSYILRMLSVTPGLCKVNQDAMPKETELLRKNLALLRTFQRGAFLLMSPTRMAISSHFMDMILDYIRMIFHLDLLQFNKMLGEVKKYTNEIDQSLTIIGMIDSYIAIAEYRKEMDDYCIPEFIDEKGIFASGLYHPLIENPVKNDLNTSANILLTGSNASGKSTFLKTVAINAIFAQTIHTCFASNYQSGMFRVYSSMTFRDDLEKGESYYTKEIKGIKRILDAKSDTSSYILCFVDEILRGTNTVERIAASCEILQSLDEQVLCFAGTHDVELTYLLEKQYQNYHFEEKIEDEQIVFPYQLRSGRAESRNAIKLLKLIGYSKEIVERSEDRAERFVNTGKWS